MKELSQNQKGFSLIELIVVVAVLGIISAALVPQFAVLSRRARMKVDVSSVKILQEQVEIYYADNKKLPGNTPQQMISTLVSEKYLDARYLNEANNTLNLETNGSSVIYDAASKHLKLKVSPEQYNMFVDGYDKSEWLVSS